MAGLLARPGDVLADAADLVRLAAPGGVLPLALVQVLVEVVAVVALIGANGVVAGVEIEDARHSAVEEGAVVADDERRTGVVGQPRLQPLQHGDVEVVGRLVQQQHIRLIEQHQGQRQARLLPPAQLAHWLLRRQRVETQVGQDGRGPPPIGPTQLIEDAVVEPLQVVAPRLSGQRRAQLGQFGRQQRGIGRGRVQRLGQRRPRVEFQPLRQIAQPQATRRQRDVPFVGRFLADEDTQQRRLAATVGADQADPLAGGNGERELMENG